MWGAGQKCKKEQRELEGKMRIMGGKDGDEKVKTLRLNTEKEKGIFFSDLA